MRNGQATFRRRLLKHTSYCEATMCDKTWALDACHIKPHQHCTDEEKMDPNNAICLIASIHRAFDVGCVSFDSDGVIMISSSLTQADMECFGLIPGLKIRLPGKRPEYLKFHRENVYKA
jgi:hypothetical protein